MEAILNSFVSSGHDDAHNHYQRIYNVQESTPHHKGHFSHEAIAAAAGFAAMKAYESHLRATGQKVSHPLMKELLASIAAAETDKLIETKGLDWMDRHRARKFAEKQAHDLAEQRYQGGTGWEYAQSQGGHAMPYNYEERIPWGGPGHHAHRPHSPEEYQQPVYYPAPGYPPPPGNYQVQAGYAESYSVQEYEGNYEGEHHHRHHEHHHHHHG